MTVTGKYFLFAAAVCMISFSPGGGKPGKKQKFIDPANMDLSIKPGDNFYLYANGNWLKNNPVPPSKTRWGSFMELAEDGSKRLQLLLQDAASNAAKDSKKQKIGDFYSSGMDSILVEKLGYEPIKKDLERISAIADMNGVLDEISYERVNGIATPLTGFYVTEDSKKTDQYIPQIGQEGTTLPDRDYYLKSDARSVTIRKEYLSHLSKMFVLVGKNEAEAARWADAVMRIESALAKSQFSRVEMRDPYKSYNKFAWNDLSATTPSIDWQNLAAKMMIKGVDSIIVTNPSFLKAVDLLLAAVPLEDWKAYLQWHILSDYAPYLGKAFVDQNFNFTRLLTGQKEISPRWQRMSRLIDATMGDELGKVYVEKYFKPEAKKRMLDLVNNLQETFKDRITRLDWMSEETKNKALEKLQAFRKKIAYPDKWKDYSTVQIKKGDLIGNIQRAEKWQYQEMIGRLGKPVDKTLWGMTPPTINAYYNPTGNEIAFPAGILQFPFFTFEADDAVNYGAIGAAIGHEMTHGFDDQGRKYTSDGNLSDWWTSEDAGKFKVKTEDIVAQYNAFKVLDTLHVNGRLTLGENIADLGGLSIAYEAFTKTRQFKENKKIDGFTPAQRFFLSWAQVWRINVLPETEAQLALIDSHSPGMHRTNGPLVNMDAWYQAFNIKEGDKMYKPKEKRMTIW